MILQLINSDTNYLYSIFVLCVTCPPAPGYPPRNYSRFQQGGYPNGPGLEHHFQLHAGTSH